MRDHLGDVITGTHRNRRDFAYKTVDEASRKVTDNIERVRCAA